MTTDRIERTIELRAPRSRVWQALANAEEFGAWFGAALHGAFEPGARVSGTMTTRDHQQRALVLQIEQVEPERLLVYRWHPGPLEADADDANEPTTLVEFHLADIAGGRSTRLTVIESGFDGIPLERRASVFRLHEQGWAEQFGHIADYVTA